MEDILATKRNIAKELHDGCRSRRERKRGEGQITTHTATIPNRVEEHLLALKGFVHHKELSETL